jgi:hypothetical protein
MKDFIEMISTINETYNSKAGDDRKNNKTEEFKVQAI